MNINYELREKLIQIAEEKIPNTDVSHDFEHAIRVLLNAERISQKEGGDPDIIIPSAIFHDIIVYPKNHPHRYRSQEESAECAAEILNEFNYPKDKIIKVKTCILECSFSKGIMPNSLESKIIQDSDGLEATGAISIMRTYSSTGQMQKPFYHSQDPFCSSRNPEPLQFALDLFYERLLIIAERMHTDTAKKIAIRRTEFLKGFLEEFKLELEGK